MIDATVSKLRAPDSGTFVRSGRFDWTFVLRRVLLVPLLGMIVLSGCGGGIKGLAQVSGKLNYKGGPWPAKGQIFFCPVKAPPGGALVAGMATIESDGSYTAQTVDSRGLMPGDYVLTLRCYTQAPDERSAGVSALPARYATAKSGLTLSVPEGSGAITKDFDIDSK